MKAIRPQLLIIALGDLQERCNAWLIEGRETIAQTAAIQRRETEHAQNMARRAEIAFAQALDDQEQVEKVRSEVETWQSRSRALKAQCDDLMTLSQKKRAHAQETLTYWQKELGEAQEWLAYAKQRLIRAREELKDAQAAYERARWAYNDAVDRYNRCIRSKESRDCSGRRRDIERAKDRLEMATFRLKRAIAEFEAAKHEFGHAQARADCCQTSVEVAQQALSVAEEAIAWADQALAEIERGLDYADAALRFVIEAEGHVENEIKAAEAMRLFCRKDLNALSAAAIAHRRADGFFESAQRLLILSRQELDYRIARLAEFDRPGLFS